MIRGIYISASGLLLEEMRSDITANNIANANTAGFKKDRAVASSFPEMLLERIAAGETTPIGSSGLGAEVMASAVDRSQGALQPTGNPLDLAISGQGFFVVQTPEGERYTRRGSFSRDNQGYLVTDQGYRLLGNAGPIKIPAGELVVDKQGNIRVKDSTATLRIVDFTGTADVPAARLIKEGDSFLRAEGGLQPSLARGYQIQQGFLEASNVNPLSEMVALITVMRGFEANQKAVQAQDETLDKAVNELGRLR